MMVLWFMLEAIGLALCCPHEHSKDGVYSRNISGQSDAVRRTSRDMGL